jgi:hypothetical protein
MYMCVYVHTHTHTHSAAASSSSSSNKKPGIRRRPKDSSPSTPVQGTTEAAPAKQKRAADNSVFERLYRDAERYERAGNNRMFCIGYMYRYLFTVWWFLIFFALKILAIFIVY